MFTPCAIKTILDKLIIDKTELISSETIMNKMKEY